MRSQRRSLGSQLALIAAMVIGAGGLGPAGAQQPQDQATHLGVASCASSTCHGKIGVDPDAPVALNEYFIWSKYDHHAGAYRLLGNAWSQRIAANMGLGDPTRAPQCLTCHADNVAPEQRGERFQLADGIGCEACHGGAQQWIDSHYDPDSSREDNLARGMLPTWRPAFQGKLCSSCHLGDEQRFVTHEMMAAGHPRLRFELDTWLANMPPHHVVDDDYRQRNGDVGNVDRWAAGLVAASLDYLDALQIHLGGNALAPEFALFDCYACHRPLDDSITRSAADKAMATAGSLRPDDHALGMLAVALAPHHAQLSRRIRAGVRRLHQATAGSASQFRDAVAALRASVEKAGAAFSGAPLDAGTRATMRRAILRAAANRRFRDYADAEQLYLALQAFAAQAGDSGRAYDRLFSLLDDPDRFDPERVAVAAREILRRD